jgi:hypothetical protein
VASGNDAKMRNELGNDLFEFFEIEVSRIVHIEEREAEFVFLILIAI